ncbi:hypothetical protein [Nocardioides sp.]|uniref:hypothetical protein n=1 Tax=Nocardioides sp. TaxID=35761 RepID=UPI0025E0BBC5|nr:hypothetical protein [Nocardioides sp.]
MTHPPSPEELYDATIAAAWRLACCVHGAGPRAEAAVAQAFAEVSRVWPQDLGEGRVRVLALISRHADLPAGATPAA